MRLCPRIRVPHECRPGLLLVVGSTDTRSGTLPHTPDLATGARPARDYALAGIPWCRAVFQSRQAAFTGLAWYRSIRVSRNRQVVKIGHLQPYSAAQAGKLSSKATPTLHPSINRRVIVCSSRHGFSGKDGAGAPSYHITRCYQSRQLRLGIFPTVRIPPARFREYIGMPCTEGLKTPSGV